MFSLPMDIDAIKAILPHREPMLLVDKVLELEVSKRCVAEKTFDEDSIFFKGHFPGMSVLPGVIMLEAMAQTGAITVLSMDQFRGRIALFGGADNVKFRQKVLPGDTLRMEVNIARVSGIAGRGHGIATVNGVMACEAQLTFVFAPES